MYIYIRPSIRASHSTLTTINYNLQHNSEVGKNYIPILQVNKGLLGV